MFWDISNSFLVKDITHLFCFYFRDVDKVHDMMDDIAEQQEVAHEISEAISNPVAFGDGVDEVEYLLLVVCNFNWIVSLSASHTSFPLGSRLQSQFLFSSTQLSKDT